MLDLESQARSKHFETRTGLEKNYKNFQRNQPLYLHGLNYRFVLGLRDHEESDSDHNSGFVVKVRL